jgi:hypothetical protein
MSVNATTVWEVRPTLGSDTNGGGFDPGVSSPGTDYSQQTSPQYALTGIASAGSGNVVLYASASSDMVGNVAFCSGGTNFNSGWFEIVSVVVGVSMTFGTNAAGQSICSGVGAAGAINIGGALATVLSSLSPGNSVAFVQFNTIWIKATGTLTVTAPLNLQSGTQYNLTFIGYTATRGDGGQVTWTTATNSTRLIEIGFNGTLGLTLQNIYFSNSASSRSDGVYATGSPATQVLCINCVFDGFTNGINGSSDFSGGPITGLICIFCEAKNCSNIGIVNDGDTLLVACYLHSCTTAGAQVQSNGTSLNSFDRCAFASNGSGLIIQDDQNKNVCLSNCAFWSNTNDGITKQSNGSGCPYVLINCIFYGNGGWGINYSGSSIDTMQPFVTANAFGSNGSGNRNNFPFGSATDITLTVDPFTNPSAGDFSLNSTTGGGTSCKGVGFPSALP